MLKIAARESPFDEVTVGTFFRAFSGLEREGILPATNVILEAARAAGFAEPDVARLEGVVLAARYGLEDIGRLRGESQPGTEFSYLTFDETRAVRQALFLLVHGPFCNISGHPGGADPFVDMHALTGFGEHDFRMLLEAVNERIDDGSQSGPSAHSGPNPSG